MRLRFDHLDQFGEAPRRHCGVVVQEQDVSVVLLFEPLVDGLAEPQVGGVADDRVRLVAFRQRHVDDVEVFEAAAVIDVDDPHVAVYGLLHDAADTLDRQAWQALAGDDHGDRHFGRFLQLGDDPLAAVRPVEPCEHAGVDGAGVNVLAGEELGPPLANGHAMAYSAVMTDMLRHAGQVVVGVEATPPYSVAQERIQSGLLGGVFLDFVFGEAATPSVCVGVLDDPFRSVSRVHHSACAHERPA